VFSHVQVPVSEKRDVRSKTLVKPKRSTTSRWLAAYTWNRPVNGSQHFPLLLFTHYPERKPNEYDSQF
jgi:hypothetical protein